MSWWPHAILHGLNPFVTHYLWSPTGVNLATVAVIPSAALVMTPMTMLFGPVFSYNMLAVASPALSAFTAYLLCRRVCGRDLPALMGGFLFGFSSYEFAQLLGHMNLTLTFLLPVLVHLSLRRAAGELSRVKYVCAAALALLVQMGLSTELLAEAVALGLVLLICARVLAPHRERPALNRLIVETLVAGLLAAVVGSAFLYYALFANGLPPGNSLFSDYYALDLTNLVFPTYTTWLGHAEFQPLWSTYAKGDVSEANGYVGIVLIVAFLTWFFGEGRRTLAGRLSIITAALATLLALGSHLHVAGIETIALPFDWLKTLPVFDSVIPGRLMVFVTLAVALGLSVWLAAPRPGALLRWLAVVLGALMTFPNIGATEYGVPIVNPAFFRTKLYTHYLSRNETVLALPFGHNDVSTLWQAETGFYFYMPEGYVSSEIPAAFEREPGVIELFNNEAPSPLALSAFIHAHRVSDVVVDPKLPGSWPALLATIGLHGHEIAGVILYHVPGSPG